MNFYNLRVGEKEYRLRMTSKTAEEMEKVTGKTITEIVDNLSIGGICTLLFYLCKDLNHGFGKDEAYKLFDEMVEAEMSLEDEISDVLMEGLVASGFMKRETAEKNKELQEKKRKELLENQ